MQSKFTYCKPNDDDPEYDNPDLQKSPTKYHKNAFKRAYYDNAMAHIRKAFKLDQGGKTPKGQEPVLLRVKEGDEQRISCEWKSAVYVANKVRSYLQHSVDLWRFYARFLLKLTAMD